MVFAFSSVVAAYENPFETTNEANDRHASERYEQRQEHGGMKPLGGYRETLGDPIGQDRNDGYSSNRYGTYND